MPGQLAAKVRAKYPGVYDDMDDATLEKAVLAKHPEYADLATPMRQAPSRPVSAEDFMTPEDIANRDMTGMDIVKGFAKGAARSVAGVVNMAAQSGTIPGVTSQSLPPEVVARFTPHYANPAQEVGGTMEGAAEIAVPAIRAAKALPTIGRAVTAAAAKNPAVRDEAISMVLGHRLNKARRIVGAIFDASRPAAKAAESDTIESALGDALGDIELPPGYSSPKSYAPQVPSAAPMMLPSNPAPVSAAPGYSMPPGYTPRATAPAASAPSLPSSWQALADAPAAAPATPPAAPSRLYFLKPESQIAAEKAATAARAAKPTGEITVSDLPASWRARVSQDLFPTTGAEGKATRDAVLAEVKARGLTVGQAIAEVSKNKDIPTEFRMQIIRALRGGAQ